MSASAPSSVALEAGKARILVVDDTPDNRDLIARFLARDGYALRFAADGEAVLAAVEAELPDLVLLDVCMPVLDGFETCRRLKAQPATADVPVIFLSCLADVEDKVRGLQLGAVDWVAKPFDAGEVRARVRNQVRLRQLQRFVPCETVGGDIFQVLSLGADRHALWLLDVAGHGVPAAMLTVSVAQSLAPHAGLVGVPGGEPAAPSQVLARLDAEYPAERFERHFTCAYALLDARRGELRTSLAAHPAPLLVRAGGTVERLTAGGTVIGLSGLLPFDEQASQLRAGDRLLMHTDGVVELEGPDGGAFGEERLADFLAGRRGQPLQPTCDALLAELSAFAGGRPPRDDTTFLALDFHGPLRA
jgi:phosphoserine phosphatase RsbU/P